MNYMELQVEILSLSADLVEAPDYIMVLPLGYISSEKGDFVVDKESFQMIQNHMQRRAIDIVIDYEHQTLNGTQAHRWMDKKSSSKRKWYLCKS